MRRYILTTLLIILSMIGLNIIQAQDAPEQPVSVLQVVDSVPLPGEELDIGEPIILYFDRNLNCESLARAFVIEPFINGDLTCSNSSFTFTPTADYARDSTYTITLSTDLTAEDGATLIEPYELELNTAGYLRVSEVFPEADTTVDPDAVITVIFNRPVVPLVSVDEMENLPNPLSITPAVEGEGEWVNTSIYMFRPTPSLAGATNYVVSIQPDFTAFDGTPVEDTFTWFFSTIGPQVVETRPLDGTYGTGLNTPVQVEFNLPMDTASVEAAFSLRDENGNSVSGQFEWDEEHRSFIFRPDAQLALNTMYTASIGEGAYEAGLGADVAPTSWSFITVPPPAIIDTDPFDGAVNVPPYGGFSIYFVSQMNEDTLPDKITVEPEPRQEPEFYYSTYNERLTVSFPPEPNTTYTITIAPGMEDPYGNTIDEPFTFSYTTGNYDSSFNLQTTGPVGFYDSQREATQLFATHTNISRIDLELYEVPLNVFWSNAAESSYNPLRNYIPAPDRLLRRWSIETNSVPNVYTYNLLNLNESRACDNSPPSRLKVGDIAVVSTEPDPLRARSEAGEGEVVDLLYKGYALPIIGGPVCRDGILWWEVRLRDESNAWVAEGLGDEYFLDVQLAADATNVTVGNTDGGPLAPGIYYLSANAPELADRSPKEHFLVVSNVHLVAKSSVNETVVWVTDVHTGQPLSGIPVTLYHVEEQVILGQGISDADGVVRIAHPSRLGDLYERLAVFVQEGEYFGISMRNWDGGIDGWFGISTEYDPELYRVYIYTDRPIYRPGQPVYFRGIVRQKDDVRYTPPPFQTVPIFIYDDRGETIYSGDVPLTSFGTFSGQFDLDEGAGLGYYRISVKLPIERRYGYEGGSVGFSVAEYRLPEFLVDVTPVEQEVVQGDTVQVIVDSKFFFGGPVSNANVEYSVVASPYFLRYTGEGRYDFTGFNYDSGPGEFYGSSRGVIARGEGVTDAQGLFTIEVPAELGNATQSQTFTVEAVVVEESQQAVAGRTDVIVHQGLVYIGARPERYIGTANQESTFEIISVDWDSNPVPNQAVHVEVVERVWSSVQEQDEFGVTVWTWEVEELPVTEGDVVTDAEGRASFSFVPPNGGIYKLIITTVDENGNEVRASTMQWVSSREYVSWRQQNSHRIDLISDKDSYSVGDTASILIASPFQGTAEAFITIERGSVLKTERVTLDSNSYVYEFPIEADYAPNIFVSVFIVKGVDEFNPVATFRMGIIQLDVDTEQKAITIDIESDVDRAQPQQVVTYTIRTTDYQGEPVQAEVGIGVTDLASLSIAERNSAQLLPFFYGEQRLSIRTYTPFTINVDELTQTTLDTIKGGGGGFGNEGIIDIRGEFVDTPYWHPSVATDSNGVATIQVRLPDNLTTWRLDARAVTSGQDGLTLVGENTFDLISTRPLLIRPVTPRFFVVGDHVYLAAVVNNNTGEEQTVDVGIDGTGVTFEGEQVQQVTIPADGRARIVWPVVVDDVNEVDVLFWVRNDQYNDGSEPPLGQGENGVLPVYKYEVPETVGTAGVLSEAGARTEYVVLPQRFEVTQGELTVSIDRSLAATTIDGLEYLRNYPYQCTEQTVSRFLPNVMTFRALNSLGLADEELRQNLDSAVNFGIQRLTSEQHADGGWGWFVQDRSNELVTAYALIGLVEAQAQGYTVPSNVINRAQSYLQGRLNAGYSRLETWRLNREAFVLYALARSDSPAVSNTVALYDVRERLDIWARAFLAQSLQRISPDDTLRTDTILSELMSEVIISATGAHWEEDHTDYYNWNTDTRTNAIMLSTLVALRPDSDIIPNLVRWLLVARDADVWETTQETAWAVMALTDWMVASGELYPDYQFTASLNGESLISTDATPNNVRDTETLIIEVADLLKDEANRLEIGRTSGNGALYYTAHFRPFLPVPEVEPLNRGIIISRSYTILGDESRTPVTEVHAGDIVQVRLTIIAPNNLHYVVIEDPLPAGADAINPNLQTSQQVGTRPQLNRTDPLSRGWGWWWFSNIEFHDEKVLLFSTYLPAGTYEYVYTIRPSIEGEYNVIPPTAQEFYFPEVYGRGAGTLFTILPDEG
ncbi:MAG: hypothetical protein D6712_00540 [Chloroflexi bacterium]|nr:MAG: hypothetical protein D6712_00540 [Chloroflexota bacterium]